MTTSKTKSHNGGELVAAPGTRWKKNRCADGRELAVVRGNPRLEDLRRSRGDRVESRLDARYPFTAGERRRQSMDVWRRGHILITGNGARVAGIAGDVCQPRAPFPQHSARSRCKIESDRGAISLCAFRHESGRARGFGLPDRALATFHRSSKSHAESIAMRLGAPPSSGRCASAFVVSRRVIRAMPNAGGGFAPPRR